MPDAEGITMDRDDHGVCGRSLHFPLMALLRAQTALLHRELEQRLDIFGRINTLPDYCQGAWPFLWYLFPFEAVLWRALAPLKQDLMHRRRTLQSLARSIPSTVVSLVDEPAMKRINSRIQAS